MLKGRPKSVSAGLCSPPLETLEGNSFLFPASGGYGHSRTCVHITRMPSHILILPSLLSVANLPLIMIHGITVRAYPSSRILSPTYDSILITSVKTLFPFKVIFKVLGMRVWMSFVGLLASLWQIIFVFSLFSIFDLIRGLSILWNLPKNLAFIY